MSETREKLVHHFHSQYRASGIALSISLAALAASELWWFYGLLGELGNSTELFRWALWLGVMITSCTVLFLSFFVQSQHYFGMRYEARFMFSIYEDKKDDALHSKATGFFDRADRCIELLLGFAFFDLLFALLYVGLYQPPKP